MSHADDKVRTLGLISARWRCGPAHCGQSLISFFVNLADNLMIGTLGDTAVSGVYMGTQIFTLLQWFVTGITTAMTILCAQFWGRRDVDAVPEGDVAGTGAGASGRGAGHAGGTAFSGPAHRAVYRASGCDGGRGGVSAPAGAVLSVVLRVPDPCGCLPQRGVCPSGTVCLCRSIGAQCEPECAAYFRPAGVSGPGDRRSALPPLLPVHWSLPFWSGCCLAGRIPWA